MSKYKEMWRKKITLRKSTLTFVENRDQESKPEMPSYMNFITVSFCS